VTVDLARTTFPALGTTAVVLATDVRALVPAVIEVRREVETIDRTCSRFRADSELSHLNAQAGRWVRVGDALLEAMTAALRAARLTDGDVDPTVGAAMVRNGYDRDFRDVAGSGPALGPAVPATGWRSVEVDLRDSRIRMPVGSALDLGATAKALAADRAARAAARSCGAGVLVSLGGDLAIAGIPPAGGWAIGIGKSHALDAPTDETVCLEGGALATSGTSERRWTRGGQAVHHIVDPRTGRPAPDVWRTVSVAAASCVDANTAATAAIVRGEGSPAWLSGLGLPARLVRRDGAVVRVGGWPEELAA
jgi:thiamine biosynthesis lipoprotein